MSERLVAMIPLKDGHAIRKEIYEGLYKQTVDIDIMTVSRPMSSRYGRAKEGYLSMSECRNIIKNEALKKYEAEYFLMLNRDVVLERENDVKDLINFLKDNKEFAAVAINTRAKKIYKLIDNFHTDIACMLIRRDVLIGLEFNNEISCNCRCVCEYITDIGMKVGYIDHRRCLEI